jgi:serine/threonine protein kinase
MPALSPGEILRGTYTVLRPLGEGAFSEVYQVRHRFMGLQALKLFRAGSLGRESDPFREAFLLSRIEHPNIVRVFDANIAEVGGRGVPFLTMEYLAGGTLAELIAKMAPLPPERAVGLQMQICAGLAVAHEQRPPIIHRDIKPANILASGAGGEGQDPGLKVSDFGLARNLDPALMMASAAGTLSYMPPEGLLSYETPASDVYSAGLIFYQLLTGRFPFSALSETEPRALRRELARSRAAAPPAPSSIVSGVPAALDRICVAALSPDARKRFADAGAFLNALRAAGQTAEIDPNAARLAQEAMELGTQYDTLSAAITRMESALAQEPGLASLHGETLRRWRAGVIL